MWQTRIIADLLLFVAVCEIAVGAFLFDAVLFTQGWLLGAVATLIQAVMHYGERLTVMGSEHRLAASERLSDTERRALAGGLRSAERTTGPAVVLVALLLTTGCEPTANRPVAQTPRAMAHTEAEIEAAITSALEPRSRELVEKTFDTGRPLSERDQALFNYLMKRKEADGENLRSSANYDGREIISEWTLPADFEAGKPATVVVKFSGSDWSADHAGWGVSHAIANQDPNPAKHDQAKIAELVTRCIEDGRAELRDAQGLSWACVSKPAAEGGQYQVELQFELAAEK